MSEPKRPRVDEPEQQDEQQVAEVDEPDSLAEGDLAAEGDGLEGDGLEEMDPLTQAFEEAQSLQQDLETINDEASDRVLAVEQEFNKRRRPIYQERSYALSRIPGFWKKVLMVHPVIRGVVTESDLDVLDYLLEVDVEDFDDIKSGFRVKFTFADGNPFFTNRELVKELRYADDAALTVTGTDIQWLPGMEPADLAVAAAEQHAGSKRPHSSGNVYSLFAAWFAPQSSLEMGHDDVADAIKDDIWPDPLRWFSQYEESMGALFELEGEDDGAGGEEDGEDEGEEEYEVDGEDGAEYKQGAGEAVYVDEGFIPADEAAEDAEGDDDGLEEEDEDDGAGE
ncbi:hypothetical protein OEZ85_013557 [Tetradesmus obliquus]|uniref:Uncharacterized protein n=1 Tax=Tetradesmus obliquus TaxID=3088 RepID=A0ABY8URN6_TETOB|nr:hypothetical protein OEZ85_013557 [Tetradesmus obliquus]